MLSDYFLLSTASHFLLSPTFPLPNLTFPPLTFPPLRRGEFLWMFVNWLRFASFHYVALDYLPAMREKSGSCDLSRDTIFFDNKPLGTL